MFNLLKSIFIALFFCFIAFTLWASDETPVDLEQTVEVCSDAVSSGESQEYVDSTNPNDNEFNYLLLNYDNSTAALNINPQRTFLEPPLRLQNLSNGSSYIEPITDISSYLNNRGILASNLRRNISLVSKFLRDNEILNWHSLLSHGRKDFFKVMSAEERERALLLYAMSSHIPVLKAILGDQSEIPDSKLDEHLNYEDIFHVAAVYESEFTYGVPELYKFLHEGRQKPDYLNISREVVENSLLQMPHLSNPLPMRHKVKPKFVNANNIDMEALENLIKAMHDLLDNLRLQNIFIPEIFKQRFTEQLVSLVSTYYYRKNVDHFIVYDELTREFYIEIVPSPLSSSNEVEFDINAMSSSGLNRQAREILKYSNIDEVPKIVYSPADFINTQNITYFDSKGNNGNYSRSIGVNSSIIYGGDKVFNYSLKLSHSDALSFNGNASYAFKNAYSEVINKHLLFVDPDNVFNGLKINDLPFFGYSFSKARDLSPGKYRGDDVYKIFRHDEAYRSFLVLNNIMIDFVKLFKKAKNEDKDNVELNKLLNEFKFFLSLLQKSVNLLNYLATNLNQQEFPEPSLMNDFFNLINASSTFWEAEVQVEIQQGEIFSSVFPIFIPYSESMATMFPKRSTPVNNQIKQMALHSETLKAQVGLLNLVYSSYVSNELSYADLAKMFEATLKAFELSGNLIIMDTSFEDLIKLYNISLSSGG